MQRFGNLKEIMQVTDTIHKYIADSKILFSIAKIQFLKNDLLNKEAVETFLQRKQTPKLGSEESNFI